MSSPHEVAPPNDPASSLKPSSPLESRRSEATGRDLLAIILAWFICAAVIFLVGFAAFLLVPDLSIDQTSAWFIFSDFAVAVFVMIGGIWWRMRRRWTDAVSWGFGQFKWSFVPSGILIGLVLSTVNNLFGYSEFGLDVHGNAMFAVSLLVVAAIATPIVEEILFRHVLYGWLRYRFGVAAAIVVSALTFAVSHLHHGWSNVGFAALAGLVFATIVQLRGTLWTCVFAHVTINSIWVSALYAGWQ